MYPQRFELLDKNYRVLGKALRMFKHGPLIWHLPFLEGARWIAGGRKKRLLTQRVPDGLPHTAKSDDHEK
jgi:hypothetical protein